MTTVPVPHDCGYLETCDCANPPQREPWKEEALRLRAEVEQLKEQIRDLQDQIAHLTGYADGLKRGSDLHEQRRGELEKQLAAQTAVVEDLQRMGRQALDSIHDRNCAGAEIILRNDLADQRARLDAADAPAASTTREED